MIPAGHRIMRIGDGKKSVRSRLRERSSGPVRPEVAALTASILAVCVFRWKSFFAGLGPDELSLLTMAAAILDGVFPYETYWDVRPPLSFLWGVLPASLPELASDLPGAGPGGASTEAFGGNLHRDSVPALRLLSIFLHAGVAWVFFCLFYRTLGIPATAVGTLVLLVSANMTPLHALVVPNHFTMAMSVAAFACLVAGLRGGPRERGGLPSNGGVGGWRRASYFASALLAGALPWTMVHTALFSLSLAALAVFAGPRRPPSNDCRYRHSGADPDTGSPGLPPDASTRGWASDAGVQGRAPMQARGARIPDAGMRRTVPDGGDREGQARQAPSGVQRLGWLAVAALPSVAVAGAYLSWGPFDALVRTVFLAPFGVMGDVRGFGYLSWEDVGRFVRSSPHAVVYVLLLLAGAARLTGAVREAPRGSALRYAPFLALPLAAGYVVIAYAKPAPEYFIDVAPAAGLLVAVAVSWILAWPVWTGPTVSRHVRPGILRPSLALWLGAALAFPFDPWRGEPKPPLPQDYCETATPWLRALRPGETVLDLAGLCSFRIVTSGAVLHPPFSYVHMWHRQLQWPWIGEALAGDGSPDAVAARLRAALAPGSGAGLLLADDRLLREVRERGWEELRRDWRPVWCRRVEGYDPGERLSTLAILVRRDPGRGRGFAVAGPVEPARPCIDSQAAARAATDPAPSR